MSRPYLAVGWSEGSDDALAAAAQANRQLQDGGWRLLVERAGLTLWTRGPGAPVLQGLGGQDLLIGRRFGGLGDAGSAHPDWADSPPPVRARRLSDAGWGAYLALLRDPATGAWQVLRDPSGALDAFTWRIGPLCLCATEIDAVPGGLFPARLALDWNIIAQWIADPACRGGRTALADISWIAPGDLHPMGGGESAAIPIWRPADWMPRPDDMDPDPSWALRLADTLERTVSASIGPFAKVVTEASGGLDSSIVNVTLAQAGLSGRVIAALHYVGDRREADERAWAEALCARAGLPLASVARTLEPVDPAADFETLARHARPPFGALDGVRDRDTAARLRASGAEALVTGKGGDALFFQMPTARILTDLWQARGLSAFREPVQAEVAAWLRRSVWSVWREALSRPPVPPRGGGRFAGWALRGVAGAPHPWLSDLDDVGPAKRLQVRALTTSQIGGSDHRRGRTAEIVQPLLAQPMMELCLSIPAWRLVSRGRDRGLARDAFAGWLPKEIATRRSKGALSSWYARRAAASAPALRSYLIDGVLADAGLLNRDALASALDPDDLISSLDGVDLVAVAAVEAWVRYWQTRVPDAPGAERYQP